MNYEYKVIEPKRKEIYALKIWPNTVLNDGKPKRSFARQAGPTQDGSLVAIHQ
jgi:hypothetical protein